MLKYAVLSAALLVTLNGCSTTAESDPARTATEELLISTAVDRAAEKLSLPIPAHSAVFIDTGNVDGTDSKYAVAAIRSALLQQGLRVTDDRKIADAIVEARAGAISIDRSTFLIGIPSFPIPVPFASTPLNFPQIALYSTAEQKGVAKFAVTGYAAKAGTLVAAQEPQYGFAHKTDKTVMIFFSWTDSDALPDQDDATQNTDTSGEAKKEMPQWGISAP